VPGTNNQKEYPSPIANPREVSASAVKFPWTRLITQVYTVDPRVHPRCNRATRIIPFIEQPEAIPLLRVRRLAGGRIDPEPREANPYHLP
jgi:hypothetical protein